MRCPLRGWVACFVALAATFGAAAFVVPVRAQAPVIAGPGLTLRYSDAQGAGCLTLQTVGTAPDGGSAITVTLLQNGVTFSGQGEEWSLTQTPPPPGPVPLTPANPALPVAPLQSGTALAFWLEDGSGNVYFFDGTLRFGVDTVNAQGSWMSIQYPAVSGQWQGSQIFPSRSCS